LACFFVDQFASVEGARNRSGRNTSQTGNVGHLDFFLVWDCLDHGCLTPEPLIIKQAMSSFATVQAFKKKRPVEASTRRKVSLEETYSTKFFTGLSLN
jgi:hypothetical protein